MKKQKNIISFIVLFLLISIISCKKNEETEEYVLKPVPVKTVYTSVSTLSFEQYLDNFFFPANNLSSKNTSGTYTYTLEREYDKRNVIKNIITETSDTQNNTWIYDYYYLDEEKGLIDSVVVFKNQTLRLVWKNYYYPNSKFKKIELYNNQGDLIKMTKYLLYQGNKPLKARYFDDYSYAGDTLDVTYTYSNNLLVKIEQNGYFGSYSITKIFKYEYDGKNGYNKNINTNFSPTFIYNNRENITKKTEISISPELNINDTIVSNIEYTYNAKDYPSTSHYVGNTNNEKQYFYEEK